MTDATLWEKALRYRKFNVVHARFDLQAALAGVPGAVKRYGSNRELLENALQMLESYGQAEDQGLLS